MSVLIKLVHALFVKLRSVWLPLFNPPQRIISLDPNVKHLFVHPLRHFIIHFLMFSSSIWRKRPLQLFVLLWHNVFRYYLSIYVHVLIIRWHSLQMQTKTLDPISIHVSYIKLNFWSRTFCSRRNELFSSAKQTRKCVQRAIIAKQSFPFAQLSRNRQELMENVFWA
jgi:hypothetical protein